MKYIAIILLFLIGCHSDNGEFKNFVVKTVHADSAGVLDLNKYDAVDWNKMYIIRPYSTRQSLDNRVRLYQIEVFDTGIAHQDAFVVMLLFKDDKLVNLTKFTRELEFRKIIKNSLKGIAQPYEKSDAIFKFKKRYFTDKGKEKSYVEIAPLN